MKLVNEAGQPAKEAVERRAGAEGNADQRSTHRAQIRARVTQVSNGIESGPRIGIQLEPLSGIGTGLCR